MQRIVKVRSKTSGYVNVTVKFDNGAEADVTWTHEEYNIQKAKEEIMDKLRAFDAPPKSCEYIEERLRTIEDNAWTKGSDSGYDQGYAHAEGDHTGI